MIYKLIFDTNMYNIMIIMRCSNLLFFSDLLLLSDKEKDAMLTTMTVTAQVPPIVIEALNVEVEIRVAVLIQGEMIEIKNSGKIHFK